MDGSILARLSPELRNRVYEYVFTSDYAVTLRKGLAQHALTKTCRQIRQETMPMYMSLTRFNAHLDDGPATPLARWLRAVGPEMALLIAEINVWDMHMLNGTVYGEKTTRALLNSPPGPGKKYILRPIGNWIFNRGWYLQRIFLAFHSMGLGLARFCIQDSDDVVEQTSKFAMVRLASEGRGQYLGGHSTKVDSLIGQFGLNRKSRQALNLHLSEGHRLITLDEGYRIISLVFGPDARLSSLDQQFTSTFFEDAGWSTRYAR